MTTPYNYGPGPQGGFPQPMQQPGLPAGAGMLRFTMPGSFWTNSMVSPTVTLNGHPLNVPSSSGSFDFPIPAGTHRLHAHGQWMKTYGNADIDFSIQPGQLVEVFYAAPVHQFANRGNIGFTPQKKPGMGALVGMLVAVIAVVLLLTMIPVFL